MTDGRTTDEQADEYLIAALERVRGKLLDKTRRNRLVNYKESGRDIAIIDEMPDQVHEHLVLEGRSFTLDRMVEAMLAGRPVRGFTDRTVSPSYVPDVVAATRALVTGEAAAGLYHCVNTGRATWFEVAQAAAIRLGCEPLLSPITTREVQLRAARPKFCALSNGKIVAAGVPMPTWQDALDRYVFVTAPWGFCKTRVTRLATPQATCCRRYAAQDLCITTRATPPPRAPPPRNHSPSCV